MGIASSGVGSRRGRLAAVGDSEPKGCVITRRYANSSRLERQGRAISVSQFRRVDRWRPRAGDGQEVATKPPIPAGIIVLNKPSGPTSRELVNQVARLLPRAKVGHAGTLDPLASGILIVCVGTATRLTDEIQPLRKSYRTVIRLGARSDTHDALGSIVAVDGPPGARRCSS